MSMQQFSQNVKADKLQHIDAGDVFVDGCGANWILFLECVHLEFGCVHDYM